MKKQHHGGVGGGTIHCLSFNDKIEWFFFVQVIGSAVLSLSGLGFTADRELQVQG